MCIRLHPRRSLRGVASVARESAIPAGGCGFCYFKTTETLERIRGTSSLGQSTSSPKSPSSFALKRSKDLAVLIRNTIRQNVVSSAGLLDELFDAAIPFSAFSANSVVQKLGCGRRPRRVDSWLRLQNLIRKSCIGEIPCHSSNYIYGSLRLCAFV